MCFGNFFLRFKNFVKKIVSVVFNFFRERGFAISSGINSPKNPEFLMKNPGIILQINKFSFKLSEIKGIEVWIAARLQNWPQYCNKIPQWGFYSSKLASCFDRIFQVNTPWLAAGSFIQRFWF